MVCGVVGIVLGLANNIEHAGPFFIGFFLFLAIGFRKYQILKGYSYSLIIFSAVTLALYYPSNFVVFNGFKLSNLIIPLIQIIMFGMGSSMSIKDFIGVIKSPKGVGIGVMCQITIMPILGLVLANLSGFPPEIAAGLILIGCSPSGLASNVMSYLANANLALSITITTVSTLLAPFLTPLLMQVLAGAFVEIDMMAMMWGIVKMVIFPIGAGLIFNKVFKNKVKWINEIMPLISMFGIAVIIVIITAAGRDSLLSMGLLLILLVFIHNALGYLLGYWAGRIFRLSERDCRTLSFEVGMQNGGLASGIAKEMGKIATLGLAAGVFGPLMNITGSALASYWHRNVPNNKTSSNLE
ncbi:bile acid:sodium symporter family protein [Membranihabitans maritimus]|uniref:bile acid:sodium symporter family protein n=1 Tax=Membranihabitans maritimus TaxID=2904244 RepID=UPI003F71B5FF